jgi:hypothetical protein
LVGLAPYTHNANTNRQVEQQPGGLGVTLLGKTLQYSVIAVGRATNPQHNDPAPSVMKP